MSNYVFFCFCRIDGSVYYVPAQTSASEVILVSNIEKDSVEIEDGTVDVTPVLVDSTPCDSLPKEDAKHKQLFTTSNEQKENEKPNVVTVRRQVQT